MAENLEQVRSTILDHADRGGRDPAGVTLVAVTKTVPLARIREAIAAGLSVLGENRVQEALPKIEQLGGAGLEWHLIGHLQRNKVRFIDGAFTMVQSLDSIGLVEALDRRIQAPLQVLLEVNVAEEAQKTGALPGDAEAIVRATAASSRLRLRGLMTIAPQSANPEDVRPVFRRLARLRTELADRLEIALPVLSMGMTDDYGVAVEEGATMLRLGRALFGPR
ncbi:MAG TPA: YggS family pyridoxal phosphate-dependent enzyme [Candidatus Dormibacteraeota bacterium]